VALAGAKLVSRGDLHGALSKLERVDQRIRKGEADRLRADVQRQLIRGASDGLPAPRPAIQAQSPA
jgi:uncharacterized protein HemX